MDFKKLINKLKKSIRKALKKSEEVTYKFNIQSIKQVSSLCNLFKIQSIKKVSTNYVIIFSMVYHIS